MLEKTLESPLDCKEIQPVNPKGNQSWIFIGKTSAEALTLWPRDAKNWLTVKDPDAGKDWRQEEKGTTEDEMVGWHYRLNGHECEQAPGFGDGQGSLTCCSLWGRKEADTTEQLNWVDNQNIFFTQRKHSSYATLHLDLTIYWMLCMHAQSFSRFWLFVIPMDCIPPGSSVHANFQQGYWSGLPFPFPGDLPNPEINPTSPALVGRFFTTEPPRKPSEC